MMCRLDTLLAYRDAPVLLARILPHLLKQHFQLFRHGRELTDADLHRSDDILRHVCHRLKYTGQYAATTDQDTDDHAGGADRV